MVETASSLTFEVLDELLAEYHAADVESRPESQDLFSDDESEDESDRQPAVQRQATAANYCASQSEEEDGDEEADDDVSLSQESTGDELKAEIREAMRKGCGCSSQCFAHFVASEIFEHVLQMRELEKNEKELYVMGLLDATQHVRRRTEPDLKRRKYEYSCLGVCVCRKAFLLCHDVGKKQLENIVKHMNTHGIKTRTHGNVNRRPAHALTLEKTQPVVTFITNYAAEHGLLMPAAPRGSDNIPPTLLPAGQTKAHLYELYKSACQDTETPFVQLTSFQDIWRQCCPHVQFVSKKDDVCATCEVLRKDIAAATREQDKLDLSQKLVSHVEHAREGRDHYLDGIRKSKEEFTRTRELLDQDYTLQTVHYTFDFAQSVGLPHHARQMGPLYFLSLRKVHIFGVIVEALPVQYNYLIEEAKTIGADGGSAHGPDSVISMLDHCLAHHGFREKQAVFNADNCGAQNKNSYVLAYFAWRVMTGKHDEVQLSMQVPGHTKCLVDGGFGLLKKTFRRSDCDSFAELQAVVERSSQQNKAVVDGWQWRDWKGFFNVHFRKLQGIRKYSHFRFSAQEPGKVFAKARLADQEYSVQLLRSTVEEVRAGPTVILQPAGLSAARQKYLHKKVRPFVRPECRDSLCPAVE